MAATWRSIATTAAVFTLALATPLAQAELIVAPGTEIIPDGARGRPAAEAGAALARWADFPASANPRPVVVTDAFVYSLAQGGSLEELAYKRGMWTVPASLPAAPYRNGQRLLSAGEAAERLRAKLEADNTVDADLMAPHATPIAVESATFISHRFATDRGSMELPAWELDFGKAHKGTTLVLALPAERTFSSPTKSFAEGVAVISPDGQSLTYRFEGVPAGGGPCEAKYTPMLEESATAVAIGVLRRPIPAGDALCLDTIAGGTVEIAFALAQPLANRVVVGHERGTPIVTLTAQQDAARRRAVQELLECVRARVKVDKCLRRQPTLAGATAEDLQLSRAP